MRDVSNKNPFQKIKGMAKKDTNDDQGSASLGRIAERQKMMMEKIKNAQKFNDDVKGKDIRSNAKALGKASEMAKNFIGKQ